MERTQFHNQKMKVTLKSIKKQIPSNSMSFTPIYLKQNSNTEPHYLTPLNPEQKVKTNGKAFDNLLYSYSKKKLNRIRNVGKNVIRSITPNQSNININDNYNNINNQNYLKEISPLPEINLNQNKSYFSQKENYDNDMPKQLQIVFSLKKKLAEVNKLLENKNQEIENLKRDMAIFNINEIKNENLVLKEKLKDINNNKNFNSDNIIINGKINSDNEFKNEINKLKKENDILNQKYNDEVKKNQILNNKINNLNKENKNNNNPNEETQKLLNQISYQEKIIDQLQNEVLKTTNGKIKYITKTKYLENELNQFNDNWQIISNIKINNKKDDNNFNVISKPIKIPINNVKIINKKIKLIQYDNLNFSIFGNKKKENININNNNSNNNGNIKLNVFKFFLTLKPNVKKKNNKFNSIKLLNEEEFEDIELLMNILYINLKIKDTKILKIFNNVNDEYIIINNICQLFKIINDVVIERFLLKISQTENGFSLNKMKEQLLTMFNKAQIGTKIQDMIKFIPELIQNCKNYDYKNEGFIPYYYFKNIYSQICFREKINLIPEEFNLFISIMKKNNTNDFYSINSLNYTNLQMTLKNNGKDQLKSKNNKKKNEDKKTNNLNLNEESPKIKQIKSFDNEINEINQDKENSIIINDFLNRVMKTAYERYKEKMSLKKIHSQNDLLSLKFN